MDAKRKLLFALLLFLYRQNQQVFVALLKENEANRTRIRNNIQQYYTMRIPQVLKTGSEWILLLSMDTHTFQSHMRISKEQFYIFVDELKNLRLTDDHQHGGPALAPMIKKTLIFLWYMGNQNSFREISDKFNVSQGTAHNIVLEVLELTCLLAKVYIKWPTECDKKITSAVFQRLCGIRGIIGVIDGCHIKIQRPVVRGGDYLNRKCFYSLLLQGIVNDQGCFIDIFTGVPGKVHDARMLRVSTFFENWQQFMGTHYLLGDTAYISNDYPFIINPKRDNGALNENDLQRNANISRGRVVVEQAFGKMKCKWRRLRDLQNSRLDVLVKIIVAACTLHNMSIRAGLTTVCEEHPQGCPRLEDDNI